MIAEVNHMSKTIDKFTLTDIHFQVEPGYIVGIVGKNGAGKTTLLNTILGLYRPDCGDIKVAGFDRVTETLQVKKEIAFVTSDCLFPLDLSPKNIGSMFGSRYHQFDKQKYEDLCSRFQVSYKKTLRKMSKGTIVKAQLAFAMSHEASLYIFDEPTAGLDPVFRKEILEYFFELVSDGTKSILISTQLTEELDQIADYILYLENGHQQFFMDRESLQQEFRMIRGTANQVGYYRNRIVGMKSNTTMTEALIKNVGDDYPVNVTVSVPSIEDIMTYYQREGGSKVC